jgi:hypothetical protein
MSTLSHAVRTIFLAGLICGSLDGICAIALAMGKWMRMFQFIASGALGPNGFQGVIGTAALGGAFFNRAGRGGGLLHREPLASISH